jgi:hypothetical protein
MTEAALKAVEPHVPTPSRRFELADLSTHGPWLLKKFAVAFPDASEQHIAGYLRGLIYDNENFFRYQDHAVMLAQMVHTPGLKMTRIVQERFVFVENKEDKAQAEAAADMYLDLKQWTKWKDAERIIVCENTDVPKALIEARLGRVFDTKVSYVRV